MIFYIMIFIISTLIMYILEKFDLEIKISNKNIPLKNIVFWTIGLIFILIVSLRSPDTAADTNVYYEFFNAPYIGFAEIGYYYLNVFVRLFTDNFNVFLFVTSVLSIGPIWYIISKQTNRWIYVFLFQVLSLYYYNFAIIRQCIAMAFIALAFYFVLSKLYNSIKSFVIYVILFLIAFSFHRISIIFFPIYFLLKIKYSKNIIIFLSAIIILITIFHEQLLYLAFSLIAPDKTNLYINSSISFGILPTMLFFCNLIMYNYLIVSKNKIENDTKDLYIINNVFLILSVFFFWIPTYGRILQFGHLNSLFLLGNMYNKYNITKKYKHLFLVGFIVYWLYILVSNPYNIYPYNFIF